LLLRTLQSSINLLLPTPTSTSFPYTTLFRSTLRIGRPRLLSELIRVDDVAAVHGERHSITRLVRGRTRLRVLARHAADLHHRRRDRKSTRLNSSHVKISYAVFCLKKKRDHED